MPFRRMARARWAATKAPRALDLAGRARDGEGAGGKAYAAAPANVGAWLAGADGAR
ncbi:MAG TPA: hypothetical protein VFS43_47165 [Polyangiaceae bacterium]|nr:hypothetical protein [Polyangiaceae bacterium]